MDTLIELEESATLTEPGETDSCTAYWLSSDVVSHFRKSSSLSGSSIQFTFVVLIFDSSNGNLVRVISRFTQRQS
jgi:hypothetical protein